MSDSSSSSSSSSSSNSNSNSNPNSSTSTNTSKCSPLNSSALLLFSSVLSSSFSSFFSNILSFEFVNLSKVDVIVQYLGENPLTNQQINSIETNLNELIENNISIPPFSSIPCLSQFDSSSLNENCYSSSSPIISIGIMKSKYRKNNKQYEFTLIAGEAAIKYFKEQSEKDKKNKRENNNNIEQNENIQKKEENKEQKQNKQRKAKEEKTLNSSSSPSSPPIISPSLVQTTAIELLEILRPHFNSSSPTDSSSSSSSTNNNINTNTDNNTSSSSSSLPIPSSCLSEIECLLTMFYNTAYTKGFVSGNNPPIINKANTLLPDY